MASLTRTFASLAFNNRWANFRLHDACLGLAQSDFEAPRAGFFPSIQLTLNHILTVDWFYVDALEGGVLGYAAFADPLPAPTMATLQPLQAAVDERLIAWCEGATPTALEEIVAVHRDGRVQREPADRLLLHLFQHQIHHRGQAHAMLSATPVPPPQLDEFFPADEAPLRDDDFSRLGWTERKVWHGGR